MTLQAGIAYMLACLSIGLLFSAIWFTVEGNLMPQIATAFAIPQTSELGLTWARNQMSAMNNGEWIVIFLNLSIAAFGFLYGFLMVHEEESIVYQRY